MFRLDEPSATFPRVCRSMEGYAWVAERRRPLLRAPDVFGSREDDLHDELHVALTRVMTSPSCARWRTGVGGLRPPLVSAAEAMASRPEPFSSRRSRRGTARRTSGAGKRVEWGALSPSTWLNPSMPLEEIRKESPR